LPTFERVTQVVRLGRLEGRSAQEAPTKRPCAMAKTYIELQAVPPLMYAPLQRQGIWTALTAELHLVFSPAVSLLLEQR